MSNRQGFGDTFPDAGDRALQALTEREHEILGMVAQGLTNRKIAEELHISEQTVKAHAKSIFRKLRVTSRVHAVLLYLRHGWEPGQSAKKTEEQRHDDLPQKSNGEK